MTPMTPKELAEKINNNETVIYDGGLYRYVGYQVLKQRDGSKLYSVGLLDLKNERTIIWVLMNWTKDAERINDNLIQS